MYTMLNLHNLSISESRDKNKNVTLEGGQSELSRANFLLLEGLEQDELGNYEDAINFYTSAVELCLQAVSTAY